jgi:hypothetical protein
MRKLKKKHLGHNTMSRLAGGYIEICERNIPILLEEGRHELFESPPKKELKPLTKKNKAEKS